ncbi:IS110 family transposase [Kocuria arenosa]|uniref:IS110 family transposase n=1 Tax=Kocuria arenosa TaxID=3071446 RepID=UPI0034D5AD33
MTIIGIDPHKSSLTAVALEVDGTASATRRFAVTKGTGPAVLAWASQFDQALFAVEGAKGLGRGIAQYLVSQGHEVLDVPSTLSMKARVLHTGGGRKTDAADARAVGGPPSTTRACGRWLPSTTPRSWICSPTPVTVSKVSGPEH